MKRLSFLEVFKDKTGGSPKLQTSEYQKSGLFPIIDQGRDLVAGYTNDASAIASVELPVIIFGDHTRTLKYVNDPFVLGADGTKVLVPRDGGDARYFFHYLRSIEIPSAGYSRHYKFLKEITVPFPRQDEQCRIAAILDKADELRTKRREALAHLDILTQSIFHSMFADPAGKLSEVRLDDLCEVSSGITKGRRTAATELTTFPYVAVSNVQDRALNMSVIKEMAVTRPEAERYRLKRGDLLLTEGGDPDKLGRGTIWNDELPWCLHQNHVFRVRPKEGVVPLYLNWYLASREAKSYFLRMAKQTTGIASINKTQLSATPVKLPPLELQQTFATRVAAVERLKELHRKHLAELDALFASLQHQAFKGEL